MIIGCKLLRHDGGSLADEFGRVMYPVGEWVEVPGNGAYVAVYGGLLSGGVGPVVAWLECDESTEQRDVDAPDGVRCYGRVRRLVGRPEGYAGPLRVREIDDPGAEVTVDDGEYVVIHAAKTVTVQAGGWCWTLNQSRPTVTVQAGGWCWTWDQSRPVVTVEAGGLCSTCDQSSPTVTVEDGGVCSTYGQSRPAVTVQAGGLCWTWDQSRPVVTVETGGVTWDGAQRSFGCW